MDYVPFDPCMFYMFSSHALLCCQPYVQARAHIFLPSYSGSAEGYQPDVRTMRYKRLFIICSAQEQQPHVRSRGYGCLLILGLLKDISRMTSQDDTDAFSFCVCLKISARCQGKRKIMPSYSGSVKGYQTDVRTERCLHILVLLKDISQMLGPEDIFVFVFWFC